MIFFSRIFHGVKKMFGIKIRCPTCKNIILIHGNPGEKIHITCPKCNTHGVFSIPLDDSLHPPQKERSTIRPTGVTILAILAMLGVMFNIIFLVTYAFASTIFGMFSLGFLTPALVINIVTIVLIFLIGYGFLKGTRWSWFAAVLLLIIWIIISILITALLLFIFPRLIFSNPLNLLISISLCILLLLYLTRRHVRIYFNVGQPGDIIATMKNNRNIAYLLSLMCIVMIALLAWGFTGTGTVTLIHLTQTPEHPIASDDIILTAEITGGSPFGGTGATVTYISYFGTDGVSGTKPLTSIGDNQYTVTFHGSDGAEIWCLIMTGNHVLANHTIQVGHVERSNITTLAIGNITQTPKNPTSNTTAITIIVEVISNVTIVDVECLREIFSPYGSSGGTYGGMSKIGNTTYSETISPHGSSVAFDSYTQKFWPGTIIYYRIIAKDEAGNTAVLTKHIII